jgi:hypothetical protein
VGGGGGGLLSYVFYRSKGKNTPATFTTLKTTHSPTYPFDLCTCHHTFMSESCKTVSTVKITKKKTAFAWNTYTPYFLLENILKEQYREIFSTLVFHNSTPKNASLNLFRRSFRSKIEVTFVSPYLVLKEKYFLGKNPHLHTRKKKKLGNA